MTTDTGNERPPGFMDRLNLAEKIIAIVGAGALAWTTYQANTISNSVALQNGRLNEIERLQKLEIEARTSVLAVRDSDTTLTHNIFKEFVGAITDNDLQPGPRIDRLSGVLVLTWAIPDPRQQEGMAKAVKQAIERAAQGAPTVTLMAKEATFDADELLVRAIAEQKTSVPASTPAQPISVGSAPRWSNYDVDVFWCEGQQESANLQTLAERIADFRKADPEATGRWRVRPMPATINQRSGYNIHDFQIRHSSDDELPLAHALKALIEANNPSTSVRLLRTYQRTPWYLSVFACR